ncbi:unnamed protein product [Bursaphelenchus xylophilus]|uniref:(pine wood nematode) hypothetical protein n=1 Tax=Bursaphelenchus xylophilus TaxID=6326 RepID=A0A1I7SEC6_BURXY|nr:unnamed protein product [Bursaphelenchus xylophilus]CAG9087487.1 unnamed protein product [Bursaphelenchus xylophilus]
MTLPEPQSPRTGLALSDLGSASSSYSVGGAGISGLAIASHGGSSNWSTRGVGGIGAGIGVGAGAGIGGGAGLGGLTGAGSNGSSSNFGFGSSYLQNCGCSSSDYGLFKN